MFVSVRNIETSKSSDGSCGFHISDSTLRVVEDIRTAAKRLRPEVAGQITPLGATDECSE